MGVPFEGVELRIVDAAGQDVPVGETGELLVRSPGACIGYWNDPDSARGALKDGRLHTGDLASCDADGTTGSGVGRRRLSFALVPIFRRRKWRRLYTGTRQSGRWAWWVNPILFMARS